MEIKTSYVCHSRPVLPPHALKGQKPLAQGIALGILTVSKTPCKGKSLINCLVFKAFALTGRVFKIRLKSDAFIP